jgi:elongation factor Ts
MDQPYVKDPDRTVGELLSEAVGRIGENMKIARFQRFVLGEGN